MAAGLGTRLRPFTAVMPKPLLPLLGVPMAQFAFDSLASVGVTNIVANIHAHAELAEKLLRGLDLGGAGFSVSDESRELLGSGGGIRTALPKLGGRPFYLLNADTICSADLGALAETHARLRRDHGVVLTLTLFRKGPNAGKYSEIFFDESSGLITRLGEPQMGKPFFVGVAIIEPDAIAHLPEGRAFEFVPGILKPAIEKGLAGAHVTDGLWFDVGSPDLWLDAHVQLMRAFEQKTLPGRWIARIAERAERLAPLVWASSDCSEILRDARSRIQAPAFLDFSEDEARAWVKSQGRLGPSAVLYGASEKSANVIGWRDLAVEIRS